MPASALFTPLQLGSTTISNRIGMSPLTRNRSSHTVPNDLMREYYAQRAAGGAGLIISEGVLITRQGTEWAEAPGIWDAAQIAGWKKITDAVHKLGSKMYCQLWHLGRLNHPEAPEQIAAEEPVYAPSPIAARGGKFRFLAGIPKYATPTEISDPTTIIALYKQAAVNAKEAGFDGVELQCANGYLVHQFLDSTSNKRTDKWGGSVENRARFALETFRALKEVFGPDVGMKVSPATGNNDMGMPLQETLDTFSHLFREVDRLGLAYVNLMRYSELYNPEYDGKKQAPRHDVLATYRPLFVHTNVFLNVEITPELAEELVARGEIAGVFFGVPWIAHPDLAKRVRAGKKLDNVLDMKTLYGKEGVDPRVGYTDYEEAVDE
ncbi:flavoprotein NADH-dependent oxidoreductase [Mycena capillaripes]|nr:flavoprotein NADH-dependent oxidoreductase [Mycena capillaripes]